MGSINRCMQRPDIEHVAEGEPAGQSDFLQLLDRCMPTGLRNHVAEIDETLRLHLSL
jgi:hypothetical protein